MLEKIFKISKEEIVRGGLILFVMINIFNFLNYVFHFIMARLLGPVDYGILAVLMSMVYIFSVPVEGIQIIISRYTTKFNIKKQYGKIKYLLVRSITKLVLIALVIFLVYIPISFLLSYFIKINVGLLIFTGLLIFGMFLIPILRGVMLGRKEFKALGYNMIIESVIKLIMAVILVLLGLKVYGAMGGVILGLLITLLVSFAFIKKVVNAKIEKTKVEGIFAYSFPVLIVMLTVILMASLDIIFAKSFFSNEIAGKYAVASMLGKMIFFGTFAIGKAMFPLTSEGYDKGQKIDKTKSIFKKAFLMVFIVCTIAVLIYWLFPKLIITILFGSQYVEVSSILVFIALAFSFISLTKISLIYSLSSYSKKSSFFIFFVFLEVLTFIIFHANITQFSIAFMIINFIMFIVSLIFIAKN